MEKIASLLHRLDTFVQEKFDSCIFFLMRRFGWTKSTIRYMLWAIIILSVMIGTGCAFVSEGHKWSGRATFNIVYLAILIFIQWGDRMYDQEAEEDGGPSFADHIGRSHNFFKVVFSLILVSATVFLAIAWLFPATLNVKQGSISCMRADITANWVFGMSNLAVFFLAKTPPTAPPIKERLTVLVPAPQRMS